MGWVDRFGLDVGSGLVDYTPIARELFVSARCGEVSVAGLPAVPPDRHRVRGVAGDGLDFAALMNAVEAAVEKDAWLVLVFHGVGGGHHLSCDIEPFTRLAEQLAAERRLEVVTYIEGAKRCWPGAARHV